MPPPSTLLLTSQVGSGVSSEKTGRVGAAWTTGLRQAGQPLPIKQPTWVFLKGSKEEAFLNGPLGDALKIEPYMATPEWILDTAGSRQCLALR